MGGLHDADITKRQQTIDKTRPKRSVYQLPSTRNQGPIDNLKSVVLLGKSYPALGTFSEGL